MRLKKLCDSHCEDLALRFANACLRCLRLPESRDFHVVTTEDQKRYILDIYIALLHKYKRTHEIFHELKHLSLEEGLQLVHRFTRKRVELSRIWKHCSSIAELAAKYFMTSAMMKPINESGDILSELLKAWIILNDKLEGILVLPKMMRRIIQAADSSAHIYICCEILNKEYGDNIKSFTIELYIRALTTDMNELEKQKQVSDSAKVEETSKRLADGFLSLADLLQDHVLVSRECVLTSFSLNPTFACMERIEKLAVLCTQQNIQNKPENIVGSETVSTGDQEKLSLNETVHFLNKSLNKNHTTEVPPLDTGQTSISSPQKSHSVFSNSELSRVLVPQTIGLSEQLCDDLAVVLSSPRYQYLSWVLDWPELKAACDGYLLNAQGSRNVVKELKYLNIDYNQFKDWPEDENQQEYGGIEKGYEHYTEDAGKRNLGPGFNPLYAHSYNSTGIPQPSKRGRKKSCHSYLNTNCRTNIPNPNLGVVPHDVSNLSSDGLQMAFQQNNMTASDKMSRFAMIMNNRNQKEPVSNHTKDKMLSIFAHMDKTDVNKPFGTPPLMQPFMLPEKRTSDPKILKTLRMFRSNKKRNREEEAKANVTKTVKKTEPCLKIPEPCLKIPDACINIPDTCINIPDTCINIPEACLNIPDVCLKPKPPEVCISQPEVCITPLDETLLKTSEASLKTSDGCLKTSDGKLIKLPLTPNMNPRVLLDRQDCNNFENKFLQKKNGVHKQENSGTENKLHKHPINGINMNPFVLLDRYEDISSLCKKNKQMVSKKQNSCYNPKEKKRRKLDVLADVPGLNSLEMIRPSLVQPTVQVVQLTSNLSNTQVRPAKSQSNSSSATATTSTLVTSTPVTAHIQRIGQPHMQDKISQENENISSSSLRSSGDDTVAVISSDNTVIQTDTINQINSTKPANSQSTPTLVNILSQQIIRPGQSTVPTTRNSALINILSQQIIKPPTTQMPQKVFNVTTSSMESSVTNVSEVYVHSNGSQGTVISSSPTITTSIAPVQLQNNSKLITSCTAQPVTLRNLMNTKGHHILKNVSLVANSLSTIDTTRLVQFLCKSDGKVVQLTPYSANTNIKLQAVNSSKVNTTTSSVVNKQVSLHPVSRSSISSPNQAGYEDNYVKFIHSTSGRIATKPSTQQGDFKSNSEEVVNSLPKFQQAFGKTGYQSSNSAIDSSLNVESMTTCNASQISTTRVQTSVVSELTPCTNSIIVNPQVNFSSSLTAKSVNTTTVTAKPIITSKSAISPLGVQAIQGSVIYTKQVPVSFSVTSGSDKISVIPATTVTKAVGRNQVFKISSTASEQINASKDNVIMRNKMSALLAAALQTNVPNRSSAAVSTITSTVTSTAATTNVSTIVTSSYSPTGSRKSNSESEMCDVDSNSNDSTCVTSSVTNSTHTLITPMRITLPMMQRAPGSNGIQTTRVMKPILQIPQSMIRGAAAIRQQVLLAAAPVTMTGLVTCASQCTSTEENLMSHSNIDPSVSSTTLEQLREFDLVLEQVKERSTVQPNTLQNKIQVVKPPVTVNTNLQEVVSNVSVSYMNSDQLSQKVSACTSVVVVTNYCSVQPAASPALSVTSQSSSSPCVTPAPSSSGSTGKTVPKSSVKSPKSKTVKTTAHASKTSPIPKPQQKPQEDEQTTQRIFDILAEYAEQLRNSPDLNNKPAPRRRSNPPTNPSHNSKRKKCSTSKKSGSSGQCNSFSSELSPGTEDPRTMGSEDSCGIVQLSVQNSPQDATVSDDHQSPQCSSDFSNIRSQTDNSDSGTESQVSQTSHQFIFSESKTNQSRNVIIADSAVSEALVGKLSNTAAVIVPANYIVPMVKGGQQIAVVSGSSKILATVPTGSGSNMLLFQSFVNQTRKPVANQQNIKSVKYPARNILSQGLSSQVLSGVNAQTPVVLSPSTEAVAITHPLSFKKLTEKISSITRDKTNTSDTFSSAIPITTGTTQTCNVIFTSDNVSCMDNLAADESSSPMENSIDESEEGSQSTNKLDHCINIVPLTADAISIESEEINIIETSQTNTLLQTSPFTLNFTSKESSVPVLSQITSRLPENEGEKTTYKNEYVQTKLSEGESSMSSGNKSQPNVIRSIADNTGSDRIISTSTLKFQQIDSRSSTDHYSKLYIEDKKKPNTNGPMLGQSDSDGHSVMRRESDKVLEKRKLVRAISEGSTFIYHKQKKVQSLIKTEKELQQRKQEALERELCLQKSLSEECEDLGVDEPSTSDLFPEADLLFDSNNSPSFDQLSQDIDKKFITHTYQIESSCSNEEDFSKKHQDETSKKVNENQSSSHTHLTTGRKIVSKIDANLHQQPHCSDASTEHCMISESKNIGQIKNTEKETTVTLFSDDDNSDSTLRTDLLFESLDYPSGDQDIDYNQKEKEQQLINGSKDGLLVKCSTSNYSGSSYVDHTLMTTCASASNVSTTHYDVNSSPLMHKYKYKYCNRKRLLSTQNTSKSSTKVSNEWEPSPVQNVVEVIKMLSSDEDTSESVLTERAKSSTSRSPSPTERKRSASPSWEEENNDESNHSYPNIYNTNKLLKLSVNNITDSVVCSAQDSNIRHRKSVMGQCTLDCMDSSTPSPLSPEDGELEAYGTGRSARRSTQRLKKKCPCCTPEKPKKILNVKKISKGQLNKKR